MTHTTRKQTVPLTRALLLFAAVLASDGSGAGGECGARVAVESIADDSVTFQIAVTDCVNSSGTYDFLVHYREPATGKSAEKVWSRAWDHFGSGVFSVTEYPPKASDEIVEKVTDVKVTACSCRNNRRQTDPFTH